MTMIENITAGATTSLIQDIIDKIANFLNSTDGAAQAIDLTGSDAVSDLGGWLVLQYTPNNTPSGNEFPLVADDGSSANLAGIRLYSGADYPGYWMRANNTNLGSFNMSNTGMQDNVYGSKMTVGLSWDNVGEKFYITSQGYTLEITYPSSNLIEGLDRLNVLNRSGSGTLDGTIHYWETGAEYLTPAQLNLRMLNSVSKKVVYGAGQSLELGATNSNESGSNGGYKALIGAYNSGANQEMIYYQAAEGGSALFKQNNSVSEYWWDEDTNSAGTMLVRLYGYIQSTAIEPSYISWAQGEQDALFLDRTGRPTSAEYKTTLLTMFNDIRSKYPRIEIYIKIIGRRTSGNTNTGGTQDVRNAQLELIQEHDWIHWAGEQYHVTLTDDVHPDDAGYVDIFDTEGDVMSGLDVGAKIVTASRTGVTITLTTDNALTTNAAIEGFAYFDTGGSEVAISSASCSGNTITVTLASGTSGTLYYIYDREEVLNVANVVFATDSKPLRSGVFEL